jgi:hypothetical protein
VITKHLLQGLSMSELDNIIDALDNEVRTLRDDNAKLREALRQERQYHRQRSFPEPFRVGTILGRAGNLSYALQILHVWHTWPNVDVEVALPPGFPVTSLS